MSKLQGKVALVTGAPKGIGAGVATGLASAGAAVAVNYTTDRRGAESVASEITEPVEEPSPSKATCPVRATWLECLPRSVGRSAHSTYS
jgi:NAD(P)-dependent dehydrogenase (short-subunit alcohol dehydrogenase family)